ncbi:MAG: nitrilase family protein [Fluviicola sp.]|nr:nitrilase family protein [Fluviicola sp.]
MQDLKVSLVQANQIWEDKTANFTNYLRLLKDVQTDLIILPEMFNTGFSMNVEILGEEWSTSPSIQWLKELAAHHQAAVYTSLIIKDEDKFYNRGVFVHPSGKINSYDKRKSFSLAKEDLFFTEGVKEVIVEYKEWKIQLQICFDLRFPEIVRNELDNDNLPKYDLILYIANWPEKRISHWDSLLTARAIENQSYVAGVNRIGTDENNLDYCGHSTAISALGSELLSKNDAESVKTIVLSSESLKKVRKTLPFLYKRLF